MLESSLRVKSQFLAMANQLNALNNSNILLVKMLMIPNTQLMMQYPSSVESYGFGGAGQGVSLGCIKQCKSICVCLTSKAAMMLIMASVYNLYVQWIWQLLQEKAQEHSLHIFTRKKIKSRKLRTMMAMETPSVQCSSLLKVFWLHVNPIIYQSIQQYTTHYYLYHHIRPHPQQRYNLNMSQERVFHSLPKKAQPTLACSTNCPKTTVTKPQLDLQGCPQISEFKIGKQNDELYVHRLQIDYGRLERPNYFYFDGPKYEKVVKMAEEGLGEQPLESEMNTKRMTGISLIVNEEPLHERCTEKKTRKVEYLNQKTQESKSSINPTKPPKKVKIKLAEVKAYEEPTQRNGSVKRLHSRIVKMAVGGGKLTTKVITYPDNKEYLKLCGLR